MVDVAEEEGAGVGVEGDETVLVSTEARRRLERGWWKVPSLIIFGSCRFGTICNLFHDFSCPLLPYRPSSFRQFPSSHY